LGANDVLKAVLKKIGAKYEYEKKMGGGGFSKVYLIRHKFLEECVLKIMDYNFLLQQIEKESPEKVIQKFDNIKKRFINEARLYKKINHPNIVKILDCDFVEIEEQGKKIEIPFLIMPYIKGRTLEEIIKSDSPLDIKTVLGISENILSALQEIHKGSVIHRDIKPANIMIEDSTGNAILIDFGLAKNTLNETKLTASGSLLGTLKYMSPEQFRESQNLDSTTDIYSYGVVLYEMLSGKTPDTHTTAKVPDVREITPGLPAGIEKIIFKALAKEPKNRYKNVMEFRAALDKLQATQRLPASKYKKQEIRKKIKIAAEILAIIASIITIYLGIIPSKTNDKVDLIDIQYRDYIESANKFIQAGDLEKAKELVTKAKEIQDTGDVRKLAETIANRQKENMRAGFDELKTFLTSAAAGEEKINRCRAFLDKHKNVPTDNKTRSMIKEVNGFIRQIDAGISAGTRYNRLIGDVKGYIRIQDYQRAETTLEKARKIKKTTEIDELSEAIDKGKMEYEKKHGSREYEAIKTRPTLDKFLQFKSKYPGSSHLTGLKKRLTSADKTLPPEKYWHKPIRKNSKGYYEHTFTSEHNGHTMIYIPGEEIWFDKYEVSWRQFRKFLRDEKITAQPMENAEFIHYGDEYPAVVSFDQAVNYCRKYGLALPRAAQWEYAAGKGKYTYPWGNQPPGTPDSDGNWRANFDTLDGDFDKDGYKGTAHVKSFEPFASPFGAVNMAGNVWEWTREKVLKGGGYLSLDNDLRIDKIKYAGPGEKEGFRCVKNEREVK
jgi:serine/threonine protein kinase